MTTNLEVISEKITTAKKYADVFGVSHSSHLEDKLRELRKQYTYMVKATHPDHVPKEEEQLANVVFPKLVAFYKEAKIALEKDCYEKPLTDYSTSDTGASQNDFEFSSGSNKYVINTDVWAEGDFSNIHLGKTENGADVFIKVASDPTLNQYLVHEAQIYQSLKKSIGKARVSEYIPKLLDTVVIESDGNKRIQANVFEYQDGYVSLTKIREVYTQGLDPRDAAWIWRRVLGQTLVAQMCDIVHGAIVPDHVLVHPFTHDPRNIGWTHSVESEKNKHARITTLIDRWRLWYPQEVLRREVPTHTTDVYMAGKTMIFLLGGDVTSNRLPTTVPELIQKIVLRCVEESPSQRPNGYDVLQQFTKTIYTLWGKTYRQLSMPS